MYSADGHAGLSPTQQADSDPGPLYKHVPNVRRTNRRLGTWDKSRHVARIPTSHLRRFLTTHLGYLTQYELGFLPNGKSPICSLALGMV